MEIPQARAGVDGPERLRAKEENSEIFHSVE
jgi:hypothetical protein